MALIGIDVGTGGSRALLLGEDGRLIASATAEHAPFRSPRAAWAEQDPEDWWRASQAAVAKEVPNVGMAVTIDIGNPKNIHPTEKLTVGKRLAAVAEIG